MASHSVRWWEDRDQLNLVASFLGDGKAIGAVSSARTADSSLPKLTVTSCSEP